jgi:hypothetical protein
MFLVAHNRQMVSRAVTRKSPAHQNEHARHEREDGHQRIWQSEARQAGQARQHQPDSEHQHSSVAGYDNSHRDLLSSAPMIREEAKRPPPQYSLVQLPVLGMCNKEQMSAAARPSIAIA